MSISQPPSAEQELEGLVARFAAAHQGLFSAARRILRKCLPTAHEVVYEYKDFFVVSYSPNGHGYEGVLALRAGADGVGLWFNQGKELPDPEKLLRGAGKQTRSIPVVDASTLAVPAVARLIDEAIKRNSVPFEPTGHGSVIIRPTSARKSSTRKARGSI